MATELSQILTAIEDWSNRGVRFGLATVVGVRGSTYRGLAARQLMSADGTSIGTVSGGCLDRELHEVVRRVIDGNTPQVVEFDLTADDEAVWGWGIGCNGATRLLVEPSRSATELALVMQTGPAAVLHGLSPGSLGSHEPLRADDPRWGAEIAAATADGRHRLVSEGEDQHLLEVVTGKPRLVVCGAGHDAAPLVEQAAGLGFEVTVVDDRRQFLTPDRFPAADALIHCSPRDLAARVAVGPGTAVVIMSHNYLRDLDYLGSILGRGVTYIGCLGPGERLARMLKDLEAAGVTADEDDRRHLHGPAGLDIGADGPREIAWAVLAEIIAVRRHRQGGSLVLRKGPAELRRLR
jgi:xanthine dehydrogenase accessory factor